VVSVNISHRTTKSANLWGANLWGARVTATQTATLLECLGIVIEEVDEVKP